MEDLQTQQAEKLSYLETGRCKHKHAVEDTIYLYEGEKEYQTAALVCPTCGAFAVIDYDEDEKGRDMLIGEWRND